MNIFGNLDSQARVLKAVEADNGLRTILLAGPSHIGKRSFISHALGSRLEEPDLLLVDHSVAGAREALSFCSSTPVFSPYRAILVDGGSRLSDAAQDAYLKLCEEPPNTSRIFLIIEDEGNMAPALFSRMENITKWAILTSSEMESFIESQPIAEDVEAHRLCNGRPGLYLAMLGKPEYSGLHAQIVRCLEEVDPPLIPVVPDAIRSLKSGQSSERDAVALICRKAALSMIGRSDASRIRRLLELSSLLVKVPSTNAEIHWQSTVLWASV